MSFYLLHAVVLINVVVAVLLEKMVEEEAPDDEESDDEEEEEKPPERMTFQTMRKSLLSNPITDAATAAREKYRKEQEKMARLQSEGKDPDKGSDEEHMTSSDCAEGVQ